MIEKQDDGQYELKFNSVAQNTANWMFGEDDYRRLARRVEFPVNYIRGRDWENVFTLMPPPFDPNIQYLNGEFFRFYRQNMTLRLLQIGKKIRLT